MSEQAEAQAPKEKPAKSKTLHNMALGGFIVVVLAVAIFSSRNMIFGALHLDTQAQTPKIVVLDTRAILTAATSQITSNSSLTTEQVNEVSNKFAANLKKIIASYHDSGYIVINSSGLITWPDAVDVTKQAAEQLGVKL